MIIVDQEKNKIINLEQMANLYVNTWSSEEWATEPDCFCIKAEKASDNLICIFLGQYKTEERAKEVLQEIVEFYEISKRYECSSNNGITLFMKKTFVYEMPGD